jgi:hypothetical protein
VQSSVFEQAFFLHLFMKQTNKNKIYSARKTC